MENVEYFNLYRTIKMNYLIHISDAYRTFHMFLCTEENTIKSCSLRIISSKLLIISTNLCIISSKMIQNFILNR